MKNQTNEANQDSTEQVINIIATLWDSRNNAITGFFNKHTDESIYMEEVAPGRNRAAYLLGHLISTHDALMPLLGFGERLYPELEIFSTSPDKSFETMPAIADLKRFWQKVNSTLSDHFGKMTAKEWLGKHTAVSEEDFAKEPNRNKLNVLLGRTNHASYHLGQLNLLNVKEPAV